MMQMLFVSAVRDENREKKRAKDKVRGKIPESELTVKRWGEKWDLGALGIQE